MPYASEKELNESHYSEQYEANTYNHSSEDVDEQTEELACAVALFILRTMEMHKMSQVSLKSCCSYPLILHKYFALDKMQ